MSHEVRTIRGLGREFQVLLNSEVDHIQNILRAGQFYELEELELIAEYAGDPKRILDIIVRSQKHAHDKYLGRQFASEDLRHGWHGNRRDFTETNLAIPTSAPCLHTLSDPRETPRKLPRSTALHYWQWPAQCG